MWAVIAALSVAALLRGARTQAQQASSPSVRDSVEVTLATGVERWQLVWNAPPQRYCNDPAEAITCPCAGYEFGDQGSAAIVRSRGGRVVERFSLDALFAEGGGSAGPGSSTFARYVLTEDDRQAMADAADEAAIRPRFEHRPLRPVLTLGDYDGDGVAAEFVLQTGAGPCGHAPSVLIGLDARGALHAMGRVGRAPTPLVLMSPEQWERLRNGRSGRLVQWTCGDHGADEEESVSVRWVAGEPVATFRSRRCSRR